MALSQTIPTSSGLSDLSLCFLTCYNVFWIVVVFFDLLFYFRNCCCVFWIVILMFRFAFAFVICYFVFRIVICFALLDHRRYQTDNAFDRSLVDLKLVNFCMACLLRMRSNAFLSKVLCFLQRSEIPLSPPTSSSHVLGNEWGRIMLPVTQMHVYAYTF